MTIHQGGGVAPGSLPELVPVLKRWIKLVGDRHWLDAGNAPWSYNERASLSVFAGAVWRSKGSVLEEYSEEKADLTVRKRVSGPGRCDIWFGLEQKNGIEQYVAEAKQCFPTLGVGARSAERAALRKLQEAREDVRRTQSGPVRLMMVFVSPKIHMKKRDRLKHEVQELLSRLASKGSLTLAWTFPDGGERVREGNHLLPGALVLIRPLRRRSL